MSVDEKYEYFVGIQSIIIIISSSGIMSKVVAA